jgi:DNA invertase Pin-like site-specific DNA recombinase
MTGNGVTKPADAISWTWTPRRILVELGLARPGAKDFASVNRERDIQAMVKLRQQLLREALAACRSGDQLVVTKLDRLARSVTDAHDIATELTAWQVKLNLGGSIHDPTDAMGKLLFTTLAMIAEFEADLTRLRTREGMKIAKAKGRLRGRAPKLSAKQEAHLVALHKAGEHTSAELAELFGVARSTVYRAIERAAAAKPEAAR